MKRWDFWLGKQTTIKRFEVFQITPANDDNRGHATARRARRNRENLTLRCHKEASFWRCLTLGRMSQKVLEQVHVQPFDHAPSFASAG